jgi:hypothetical protein
MAYTEVVPHKYLLTVYGKDLANNDKYMYFIFQSWKNLKWMTLYILIFIFLNSWHNDRYICLLKFQSHTLFLLGCKYIYIHIFLLWIL